MLLGHVPKGGVARHTAAVVVVGVVVVVITAAAAAARTRAAVDDGCRRSHLLMTRGREVSATDGWHETGAEDGSVVYDEARSITHAAMTNLVLRRQPRASRGERASSVAAVQQACEGAEAATTSTPVIARLILPTHPPALCPVDRQDTHVAAGKGPHDMGEEATPAGYENSGQRVVAAIWQL